LTLRNYILILIASVILPISVTRAQNLPTSCVNGKVRYGISPIPGSTVVWNITGGSIIANYNDSVDVQWGNIAGIQSLSYVEINASGCSSPEGTGYVVLNSPFTELGLTKQICIGNSETLDAGAGFSSYRWNDGSTSSTLNTSSAGIYWVDVTDAAGCTFRDSVTVAVNTLPVVNLGSNQEICEPSTLTLDAGNFGAFFEWSNGDNANSIIAREGDGKIWLRVTDTNGCIGSDTIEILKCVEIGTIPNSFTPNGDGKNDVWHVRTADQRNNFPNMLVKIYDRWGRLVFSSERGYGKPWDGTSKGKQLPMDTYYYIIDYGDGSKERAGSVAIIR